MLSGFSWTGGALGAQPTIATEPAFSAAAGTQANAVYSAPIGGESGQAIRQTGARDFTLPVSGNHWRIGQRISRIAGTQTAGLAALLLRFGASGTPNRGDVFLRNQNGGNWSLRGGAGATTFLGQDTSVVSNGSGAYRLELEYTSDGVSTHTVRLLVFYPGNTSGTRDIEFSGTLTSAVDNVRVLNPTGPTGLTMDHGTLWYEDSGAPIWEGDPEPVPGTVVFLTNLVADGPTALEAAVKVADAESVQLEVTPTGGGTPVVGALVVPDEFGYAHPRAEGLTPDVGYTYRVLVDGVQRATGSNAWTQPAPGAPTSYRGGWGSCIDTATSGVFGLIAARGLRQFHFLGDDGYTNSNSSPFGSISPTDEPTRLAQRETWLTAAYAGTRPQLWSAMTVYPNYSDCDGAGGNADGTTGGHATGVVQSAFRRQYALPHLDLAEAACYVVPMGRVWEVHTDETAAAAVKTAPDTEAKLKLGAAQQAWFFDVIDRAKAAGAAILWFGDGPIAEPAGAGGATGNSWAKYHANLLTVTAYAMASGVPIRRFHGDTHTLFLDDGTNGPNRMPSISAAPVHTTAQPFNYPTSGPTYPDAPIDGARQYGVYEIHDDGNTITLEVWGYSSTTVAPTEVEPLHAVYDITPSPSVAGLIVQTVPAVTSVAAASVNPPPLSGTVAAVTPAVTASAVGAVVPPGVDGVTSATTPAVVSEAAATIAPPEGIAGVVTAVAPAVQSTTSGAIALPPVTGQVTATVAAVVQTLAATIDRAASTRMVFVPTPHRPGPAVIRPRPLSPPIWPSA